MDQRIVIVRIAKWLKVNRTSQNLSRSMVFYESPHRIIKTLTQFIEYFGRDREVSVSREITKIYEETKRGKLLEVLEYLKNNSYNKLQQTKRYQVLC